MTLTEISQEQLDKVAAKLRPDVAYIRASVDSDWDGDPAIHFRVVLSDDVDDDYLFTLMQRVASSVEEVFQPRDHGRWPYINYRLLSEQQDLDDPQWR